MYSLSKYLTNAKETGEKETKRLLLIYTCGGKWWMKSQLG